MARSVGFPPTLWLIVLLLIAAVPYRGDAAVTRRATFSGENQADQFGISLASPGDVSGDSYEDLIVGANFQDTGRDGGGKCCLYFGGAPFDYVADLSLTGESPGDGFGSMVAIVPDIDGDAYSELIAGAPYHDAGGNFDAGRVYLFLGGPSLDATYDGILDGEAGGTPVIEEKLASAGNR